MANLNDTDAMQARDLDRLAKSLRDLHNPVARREQVWIFLEMWLHSIVWDLQIEAFDVLDRVLG